MGHPYAYYCKSYADDFPRLRNLLLSLVQIKSEVPLLLSVPAGDLAELRRRVDFPGDLELEIIADEDYLQDPPLDLGWLQQQVCKLSVHRTQFADSFLAIDSDSYLVAPADLDTFRACGDFKVVHASLFTKYSADNAALIELLLSDRAEEEPTVVQNGSVTHFLDRFRAAQRTIDLTPTMPPWERGPFIPQVFGAVATATQPGQMLHSAILTNLHEFLTANGCTVTDLILLAPWEYNWYAYFAAASPAHRVRGARSPILHFASQEDVDHALSLGIRESHVARRFVAVQMAARHFDALRYL